MIGSSDHIADKRGAPRDGYRKPMTDSVPSWLAFAGEGTGRRRLGKFAAMAGGLVFLLYSAEGVISGQVTGGIAVVQTVALLVFAACYLAVPFRISPDGPTVAAVPLLGVLAALAIVCPLWFGSRWLELPLYLSIVCAMGLSMRLAVIVAAAMAVTVTVQGVVAGKPASSIATWVVLVAMLSLVFISIRNTRLLVRQLRQARADAAGLAASEERLRIARDLHDLLGHSLSLIVLKSELARRLAERESAAATGEITDVETVARQALAQVRQAVNRYREPVLAEELDAARAVLKAANISATVHVDNQPNALDTLFAWTVREAITNIVRHSNATHCVIASRNTNHGTTLTISDNGTPDANVQFGNGLAGLDERIEAAHGTLTIAADDGFTLTLHVPADHQPSDIQNQEDR